MSWTVFAIAAWLMMGLELGLRDALELGRSGVTPSFVVILLAFVASHAPKHAAVWAGGILGALLDLTAARPDAAAPGVVTTLGPGALGGFLAAYTVVVMRGSMMRRNPLTLSLLSFVATIMLTIAATTLLEARSLWDPALRVAAGHDLWIGLLRGVYTALVAAPIGAGLGLLTPLFAFQHAHRMRGWRS